MKFSVRMFPQMVLHVLYLEKENGNVPYHLPEKRVVPVEKQMKRSIFLALVIVDKWYRNFGHSGQSEEKGILRKVLPFFRKHSTGMKCSI